MPTPLQVAQWLDKSVGKKYDTDGAYGAQCYDLANAFADFVGVPRVPGAAAKVIFDNAGKGYTKIRNTASFVPKVGDIMVWGAWGANPYGHVAVVRSANKDTFKSLDQNWINSSANGSPAAYVTHNYTNPAVIGVIRPNTIKEVSVATTATAAQVTKAYKDILERAADAGGLKHYTTNGMNEAQVRADLMKSAERKKLEARKVAQAKATAAAEAAKKAAEAAAKAKADAEAKTRAEEEAKKNAIDKYAEENNNLLKQILALLKSIFNR